MSNKLRPGSFAPNFKTIAYGGKLIDTSEMRGRKIWLLFYRYATCPLCCMHLSSVLKNEEKIFARNISLLVVFETSIGKVTSSICGNSSAHFPMIADPQKKLYELYATETNLAKVFRPTVVVAWLKSQFAGYKQGPAEGDFGQVPASFLIDELGVIRTAYYGKTIADNIPWAAVEKFSALPAPTNFEEGINKTKSILIEPVDLEKTSAMSSGIVEKTVTDIWKKFGGR